MGDRILAALAVLPQIFLKQMVELNRLFQKDLGKTASVARGAVELNRLFQIDRGKTASGKDSIPQSDTMTFALSSNSIRLLWHLAPVFLSAFQYHRRNFSQSD